MANQIEEIKEKLDLVDYISQYLPLTKAGKNYKALCPFHSEKTPSFMVSPELGVWKCFGCGEGGDIYQFLMKMEGLEFGEALRTLAQKAGVTLESYQPSPEEDRKKRLLELNQLAARYFNYLLTQHEVGRVALEYLKVKRGFADATIAEFNLGYAPDSWDSLGSFLLKKGYSLSEIVESGLAIPRDTGRRFYDRFRGRVMFPLKDHRGRNVGFSGRVLKAEQQPKYINTPETLIFHKREFLYGLYEARQAIRTANLAIVAEGETDFLTPYVHGTKNIVASKGTALTLEQIRLLKRYTENIAICFDTDLAGDTAARRGIDLAEKEGLTVSVVILPQEYKDPDECVRADPEAWQKAVAQPVPVYDFYFTRALARYNPRDPIGKKRISNLLLPVVNDIPNEIVRAHYAQRLAQELDLGLEVIQAALSNIKKGGQAPTTPKAAPALVEVRAPHGEAYILSLLLKAPADKATTVLHRLGKDDFTAEPLREIFTELKAQISEKGFDLAVVRAKISASGAARAFEELALYDWDLTPEVLTPELEEALRKLKAQTVRRTLKNLAGQIRAAERESDAPRLKSLQEEFRDLSSKIASPTSHA